mgnify:CR=1 FL=1
MLNKLRTINMMELFEYFDYEFDNEDEVDDF